MGLSVLVGCTGPWGSGTPLDGPDAGSDPGGAAPMAPDGSNCVSCHLATWNGTSMPPHPINKFGQDCASCHTSVETWQQVMFAGHDKFFPLDGKHATLACTDCHGANGAQAGCVSCHQKDFDGAKMPDHAANNFPKDCTQCHNTKAWQPASFDHSKVMGQPCANCHQKDFDGAKMPDHTANNFPKDCSACHNTMSWQPAMVDHTRLQGTACVTCHMTDYQNATQPNHMGAKFSTNCAMCHTTSGWQPANWDHSTYFPITTGAHSPYQHMCSACHRTPTDYSQFTCAAECHPQNVIAPKHTQVTGFVYSDAKCYQCHPQGRAN